MFFFRCLLPIEAVRSSLFYCVCSPVLYFMNLSVGEKIMEGASNNFCTFPGTEAKRGPVNNCICHCDSTS